MALMLGTQRIGGVDIFAGWNDIQKKIRMRDRGLSAVVYDFYVQDGQAILSAEIDLLEADTAVAKELKEEN